MWMIWKNYVYTTLCNYSIMGNCLWWASASNHQQRFGFSPAFFPWSNIFQYCMIQWLYAVELLNLSNWNMGVSFQIPYPEIWKMRFFGVYNLQFLRHVVFPQAFGMQNILWWVIWPSKSSHVHSKFWIFFPSFPSIIIHSEHEGLLIHSTMHLTELVLDLGSLLLLFRFPNSRIQSVKSGCSRE